MSDWSFKPIGEVRAGDEVVGFTTGVKNKKHKLVKSRVLKVQSRLAKTVWLILESGKRIRCTPDHQWYTGRSDNTHRLYAPAKIGSSLKRVTEYPFSVCPETLRDKASWIGGIYDGEGSCSCGSISITQSYEVNKNVCDRIEDYLNDLGFSFNYGIRKPSASCLGKDVTQYWINGGRNAKLKFIKWCNPAKKGDIIDSVFDRGCWMVEADDRVIDIIDGLEEEVFALQTETGNYVVWGYASKNCLYQNSPVDSSTALFKQEDFRFYNNLEVNNLNITCTCDPAGEGDDFTGITVVGTDSEMRMYVLDAVNKHLQLSGIVSELIRLSYRWKFRCLGIETNFYAGALEKELNLALEDERANKHFTPFSIEAFRSKDKVGEGKWARVCSLQPYHERGDILFPGDPERGVEQLRGAFSELAYQMMQRTADHEPLHDDLLDSLAYHVRLIRRGYGEAEKKIPENSIAEYIEEERIRMNRVQHLLPRKYRRYYEPVF